MPLRALLLLVVFASQVAAWPDFMTKVPNSAVFSADPNNPVLGHWGVPVPTGNPEAPYQLPFAINAFGDAFRAAGFEWTKELCEADSDGDGQTNGMELGDPCCTWKEGQPPFTSEQISHPACPQCVTERSKPMCGAGWWIKLLLGMVAAVTVGLVVTLKYIQDNPSDRRSQPVSSAQVGQLMVQLTGSSQVSVIDSSAGTMSVQIVAANPAQAYEVIQVLSSTSGSVMTTVLVQQLKASNYTGPMPTMVTTVIQSVTESGANTSDSSATATILIAVAALLLVLLLAALLTGALVYLYKRRRGAPTADVPGVEINPVHKQRETSPQV